MMTACPRSVVAASVVPSGTDRERGIGAVDLTHLCSRGDVHDRGAPGAGDEQPVRIAEERHVALAVLRSEFVLQDRFATLGHVPDERDCRRET